MVHIKKFSDPRLVTIYILITLAVTGLVLRMNKAGRPVRSDVEIIHKLPVSGLPAFNARTMRSDGINLAAELTVERLSRMKDGRIFSWAGGKITAGELKDTLKKFIGLLNTDLEPEDFRQKLNEGFRIYRIKSRDKTPCHRGPVLVTGYFQPELQASYKRDGKFQYPLYAVPDDLISIDLKLFSQGLPAKRLCGRVVGKKMLPYYTREEIDREGVLLNTPVLAWLASSVDGLMLHIQGSGLLKFPDGESRYIHFATDNGHAYGSIGKWLIKKGWLKLEDADWPGIRAWAHANAEKFRQALRANPRYIFFKWEKQGPVGSLGTVLVPMISAAMDPVFFPPGALCFLNVPGEASDNKKWNFRGFILNQDRGSAIKGPCRVDLYCGQGDRAGHTAGMLRHRGDMYILMAK